MNWPNLRLDDLFDQGFRAAIFASEIEAEVALVVDVMLPTERLVDAMQAFERESQRSHCEVPP